MMAEDPVAKPGESDGDGEDIASITLSSPDIVVTEDEDDSASIDHLLSMTGAGLDFDEQVKTLQQATNRIPRARDSAVPTVPRSPKLVLPTAQDLGAKPQAPASMRPTTSRPVPDGVTPSRRPPPLPKSDARVETPRSTPPKPEGKLFVEAAELLQARVFTLEKQADKVGLGRAHIELALVNEILGDDTRAIAHARAALKNDPNLTSAHHFLRRHHYRRSALGEVLEHLDHEISHAAGEAMQVELVAERGRVLDALGEKPQEARAAWQEVLLRAPHHAAALRALEVRLRADADLGDREALEAHAAQLGRLADAYAAQPELAAWLLVERAEVLEFRLGRTNDARASLEQALGLDPRVGLVREALVGHAARHRDAHALARLLEQEALVEVDDARAARLEMDAATIVRARLRDDLRAIALLERAIARSGILPSLKRRALDQLVALYETADQWPESKRARRARLELIVEPALLVHELKALAILSERLGDTKSAQEDLERARLLQPFDEEVVRELDRLLSLAHKHEDRLDLWLSEAARLTDPTERARVLVRAASICEHSLGRTEEAIRHLRAAWAASPGHGEALDALARLLAPAPSARVDGEVRALIELYMQAAAETRDRGQRIALLERAALLWEELLGDMGRAARTLEQVLDLEPDRRTAIFGLARVAARAGDERALSRGLLDQARLSEDPKEARALRVRAARALMRIDAPRARALVEEVLAAEPSHREARVLELEMHRQSGQWELVARSLRSGIEYADGGEEKCARWLELAVVQEERLRKPYEALESLKTARRLRPSHPLPPERMLKLLESIGDFTTLRASFEELANTATTQEERVRLLTDAAEIADLRSDEPNAAVSLYTRALELSPDDDLVEERLLRLLAASVASEARLDMLAKRAERHKGTTRGMQLSFTWAWVSSLVDRDVPKAISALETIVQDASVHLPALRVLESTYTRSGAWLPLARVFARQAQAFTDVRARLGALWQLASVEQWRLAQPAQPRETFTTILSLDPTDAGALEASLRTAMPDARRAQDAALSIAIEALRGLTAHPADMGQRIALRLSLAMLLEVAMSAGDQGELVAREALERYRVTLQLDPLSVTAASALARLANMLRDTSAAVEAAVSLADLATHPQMRARYLLDGADLLLLGSGDTYLGSADHRRNRAAKLLEQALDTEPDSTIAASKLAALRTEAGEAERLVDTFRTALQKARSPEAIVLLGTEIARVAQTELRDPTTAIAAMRKVREVAPDHGPSLLMLAELYVSAQAWHEAAEVLRVVARNARDKESRITAFFALASVQEKFLHAPADAEESLRGILELDPNNVRALRALLHKMVGRPGEGAAAQDREPDILRITEQLVRLETDPAQRTRLLLQLAELRFRRGERSAALDMLVESVAQAPDHARSFTRLARVFRTKDAFDAAGYARALEAVIRRGQEIGHVDARWFAALGHVKISALEQLRDGIQHLQRAVQLNAALVETRLELASAYARIGAHDEASRVLLALVTAQPSPLLDVSDPAAALELLERVLTAQRRTEEAVVASELRLVDGSVGEAREAWLRDRRLGRFEPPHTPLDRPALVAHVMPPDGRHVLFEVAAACSGIEQKVFRAELAELGVSPKERILPRSGHKTRLLMDRMLVALGLVDIGLLVSPVVSACRIVLHDGAWLVVPRAMTELPERAQLAAMARVLVRFVMGVPWLEEVSPPQAMAMLVALARQIVPAYGDPLDAQTARFLGQYEATVRREISRKQKKLLEELAPHLSQPLGRPPPIEVLVRTMARTEVRGGYLLTGDLLATIDELRARDAALFRVTESPGRSALAAVLEHPLAGDVARFALTSEASALRRRVGSIWATSSTT